MIWRRALGIIAGLVMGVPVPAATASGNVVWVELCDPLHPEARIPLPLRDDRQQAPAKACHAAGALTTDRRSDKRRWM